MGLNYALVIVGLIICFGGIYLRNFYMAFVGFASGCILTILLMLMGAGFWWYEDKKSLLLMALISILCAIMFAVYDKICSAFSSFLLTALILYVIFKILDFSLTIIFAIAALGGILLSIIVYEFYEFMITFRTAFIGGLMASFGTYGIVADLELGIVIRCILRGDSSAITWIAIETLALCLLGMYVQNLRKGRTGDEESDEDADDIETNSNFK